MYRFDIINALIKARNYNRYLEIGIDQGICFCAIKCKYKIGVDPDHNIPHLRNIKSKLFYPNNFRNRIYRMESNSFFNEFGKTLKGDKMLDIVLVDGLHTFKQSISDITNCLQYLDESGIIVVHDCIPPHVAASTPAENLEEARTVHDDKWTGEWCGDVWKSMILLSKYHSNILDIKVLPIDYGIGLVQRKINKELIITKDEIESLRNISFSNFSDLKERYYNIISPLDFQLKYC